MVDPGTQQDSVRRAAPPLSLVDSVGAKPSPAARIPEQYERLLSKLTQAEQELASSESAGRSGPLEEASGIVFDLLYALDFRRGGELVPRLAALYGYIGNELLNVGRTGDRNKLAHLRDMIVTLKESWHGETA